jgi:hypothetical protein
MRRCRLNIEVKENFIIRNSLFDIQIGQIDALPTSEICRQMTGNPEPGTRSQEPAARGLTSVAKNIKKPKRK